MEEKLSIETIISDDGTKQTFYKGQRHSYNGKPAVDGPELKVWYENGVKHRINGPAMIYKNGKQYYYVEGVKTGDSLEEHLVYLETYKILGRASQTLTKTKWYKRILKYIGL